LEWGYYSAAAKPVLKIQSGDTVEVQTLETPTHFIAMGLDPDLNEALKIAVREAIDFLVTEKHLTREDAYQLCSVAVDFNVTQAVDGTKGIHGMIPKIIFK
jgi:acetamidase/formamidase